MIRERDRLKAQWQQTRDAVEKLKLIKKKNLLKFMMRQGFEVKDWIMNSPTELLSKITIDPAMEKMIGKHDTSQDPNIIVAMNNRIESLKAEMDNLVQQTKYLNQEIKKIEIRLGKR